MQLAWLKNILSLLPSEALALLLAVSWALLRLLERLSEGKLKGVRLEILGKEVVELSIQSVDGNKTEQEGVSNFGN
jgi:hypothetical protein